MMTMVRRMFAFAVNAPPLSIHVGMYKCRPDIYKHTGGSYNSELILMVN